MVHCGEHLDSRGEQGGMGGRKDGCARYRVQSEPPHPPQQLPVGQQNSTAQVARRSPFRPLVSTCTAQLS